MANEPEREIEKTLRTYAKERGDATGGELHPATRKLLLDEAARVHPAAERKADHFGMRWLWSSAPGLAWSFGLVVVIALTAGLLLPLMSSMKEKTPAAEKLAFNRERVVNMPSPAPMVKTETVAKDARGKNEVETYKSIQVTNGLMTVQKKAEMTAMTSRRTFTATNAIATDHFTFGAAAPQLADVGSPVSIAPPMAQPAAAAATIDTLGVVTNVRQPNLFLSGSYIATRPQLERMERAGAKRADGKAGDAPVLKQFRVEQTGNALRLIDGDGSVYTGHWESATREAEDIRRVQENTNASAGGGGGAGGVGAELPMGVISGAVLKPGRFFRVSGTNVSLKQKVVFTGRFEDASAVVSGKARVGTNVWDILARPTEEK